jgi:hypothetical protein
MEKYGAAKKGDYYCLPAYPDSLFTVSACGCLVWKDGFNSAVENELLSTSLAYIKDVHAKIISLLGDSFEVVYEHRYTYLDWTFTTDWFTIVHERYGYYYTYWINGRQKNQSEFMMTAGIIWIWSL